MLCIHELGSGPTLCSTVDAVSSAINDDWIQKRNYLTEVDRGPGLDSSSRIMDSIL